MDSPPRLPETDTIAHDNVQNPRTFLTSSPISVPHGVSPNVSDGELELAQGDSGAENLESGPQVATPSPGSSEVIRLRPAAEKEKEDRDPDANEDRVSRGFRAPHASSTDDNGSAASVSSHVKDDVSPDPIHAAMRPGATVAGDGRGARGEDPRPSSRVSELEEDGGAEQRGTDVEEKAGSYSAASEPVEGERRPRPGAKDPAKERLRPVERVASVKRVQPFGIIVLLMYIAIVITLVVLTIALFTQKPAACTSTECQLFAKLLESSADASVSPCDSFARFVCAGWERSNALSVREALYQKALDRMTKHIRNVRVPDSGQNDVQRAAAAFRSCENVLSGRLDHLAAVKGALLEAGITWPRIPDRVDILHTLLFTSLKLAWDVIVRVVPRRSGNITVLAVNPGRLFHRIVEMATNSLSETEFTLYFNTLRRAFGTEGSDEIEASLVDTAALEKITALALVPKYNLYTQYPVPLTVPRDIPISDVDWLATVVDFGYNGTTEVALVTTGPSFVGAFLDLWRRIGSNNTHLLTSWSTVQVAALYANKDLILNYYGGKTEAASVRYSAFCFTTAYLLSRGALLENHMSEAAHKDARASAESIIRSVGNALRRRLSKWSQFKEDVTVVADWSAMPSEAFYEAQAIAADDGCYGSGGGVPDLTDSLLLNWRSSSRLMMNVPDHVYEVVGAINSLELSVPSSRSKTLRLLPLSLSFPVFDERLPLAANYAGLGGQMGSALSWLLLTTYAGDVRTADVVWNLSECVKKGSSRAFKLDSALSQAFTAGALVDAYEYKAAAHDTRIGEYSGTRLLLMVLCFFTCAGRDTVNEGAICDSAMRQSRQFARAFNCESGTPMNPDKRCNLP
ncbi:endothelin-converting enzyme 1-like [Dermacentor albipictus]|uniref:endothelin-converting enzyme 1-like n=1 Tax=Dermacentor albipictus TaxID=60249 RepID=UPI0031FBF0D7